MDHSRKVLSTQTVIGLLAVLLIAVLAAPSALATTERVALKDLDEQLAASLQAPLRAKLAEISGQKNDEGIKNVRGSYSRLLSKVSDEKYEVSFLERRADPDTLVATRMALTLEPDPAKKESWKITNEEVVETYDDMHRALGLTCYDFDKFDFDREGLKVTGSNGSVCEYYRQGTVMGFALITDDLKYDYTAPKYLDFYTLQQMNESDWPEYVDFDPKFIEMYCDADTCEELLDELFTGLDRIPADQRKAEIKGRTDSLPAAAKTWMDKQVQKMVDRRKESPFADFGPDTPPGNRNYVVAVNKNDKEAVGLRYNNWGGFELTFWARINDPAFGIQSANLYGYYTEETTKTTPPYELEARPDLGNRWYDLYKVTGEVEVALNDPEMISGDVEYGVNIRQDIDVLPFFVATKPRENVKRPSLFLNSVEYEGKDLTWVQVNPYGGYIVFPEVIPGGTKIDLRIVFSSRALHKVNHAFTRTPRGSWLPLVRFGDFIEEFDMVYKSPSKYTLLGIGKKVHESTEGGVTSSRWVAESPVEFPSIIFGKYQSVAPKAIQAKKLDGTPIPIAVHVDEVSKMQLDASIQTFDDAKEFGDAARTGARGIRSGQQRSIGEQAAAAINIYAEVSGVDYPYGELNLVNDPAPALYGQAPSSLIYLGSWVFRGEGTMSGDTVLGGGGKNISKFLKSVTAHEVGHQWWGSRVANANGRNYWFVETLAEYFSAIYLERTGGPKEYQEQVDEWRRVVLDRDMRSSVQNASVLWAGENPGGAYQAAVYNKGPYAFHILRQTFGDERFFAFLKKFTQELTAKGEIVSRDIQIAAESALGGVDENGQEYRVDLEWFFDQWIRGVGVPQYSFNYDVRKSEEGKFIVEGSIEQRVVVGDKRSYHVMEDKFYRGVVPITIKTKSGKEYKVPVVIEGAKTPFRLPPISEKPIEVALNKYGDILSHDVLDNQDF
ncbi:MAG: M1 family metallopeptidase [bacterium]|nr:M1 family metallopeptidase [bacterium]